MDDEQVARSKANLVTDANRSNISTFHITVLMFIRGTVVRVSLIMSLHRSSGPRT
jgi:hypothetical protein